jgi:CxxC motif-containing protein (DUF1111 family)
LRAKPQPTEPPDADPHVRWCGRGRSLKAAPLSRFQAPTPERGREALMPRQARHDRIGHRRAFRSPLPPNRSSSLWRGTRALACALVALAVSGCDPVAPLPLAPVEGEQIGGLTEDQRALFSLGRQRFTLFQEPEAGAGPLFNARTCSECHGLPAIGGSSEVLTVRAGARAQDGTFPTIEEGSLVASQSLRPDVLIAQAPLDANVVVQRRTLPLFGAGLIETIDDDVLLEQERRWKGRGVRGRVHWIVDPLTGERRAGRFGWKAAHASLDVFCAKALRDELGVTTPLFATETTYGADPGLVAELDAVADPEMSDEAPRQLAVFLRLLAPLEAAPTHPQGEALFGSVGCAECHVPSLPTGEHEVEGLRRRRVPLYSDLLLHVVGVEGLPEGDAAADEVRTPPLWGLQFRGSLWHDGRAAGIREAIAEHGGEATETRAAFNALTAADQGALVEFLRTR